MKFFLIMCQDHNTKSKLSNYQIMNPLYLDRLIHMINLIKTTFLNKYNISIYLS